MCVYVAHHKIETGEHRRTTPHSTRRPPISLTGHGLPPPHTTDTHHTAHIAHPSHRLLPPYTTLHTSPTPHTTDTQHHTAHVAHPSH